MSSSTGTINKKEERKAVSKECISCDACNTPDPKVRCSNCRTVYYCDKTCATKHWPAHKPDCRSVEDMRQSLAGIGQGAVTTRKKNDNKSATATDDPCGICLEEDIRSNHPIVLEGCRHTFCFACLSRYQKFAALSGALGSTKATCPLCRGELPDLPATVMRLAAVHAARAGRKDVSPEERQEQSQLALDELQKLLDIDPNDLLPSLLRGEILDMRGDHTQALQVLQASYERMKEGAKRMTRVNELMEEAKQYMDAGEDDRADSLLEQVESIHNKEEWALVQEKDVIDTGLRIARAQQNLQDWPAAKDTYRYLLMEYPEQQRTTPPQQREIFMGFSRCFYEEGAYDEAISLGEGAIEMNRHFPGVHKYVALAYRAKGCLEEARNVMSRAVLYETPWDENNMEEVRKLWEDMME